MIRNVGKFDVQNEKVKRMKQIEKREKGFFGENSRAAIIMLNAAVVLVVVIVALISQLIKINTPVKVTADAAKSGAVIRRSKVEENEKPKEEKNKADSKVEKIRKDLDKDKPMVALTFDDGPYGKVTTPIVKTLKKYDARATFFVVGNRIQKYPDALKNAAKNGNQIGTHTYVHANLSKLKKADIKKEMARAISSVENVIGEPPTILRPPYGSVNDRVCQTVEMPMICWNVDTEDWNKKSKKAVLKECKNIKDGDIVLMHDLYSNTAKAVESLVPALKKKGIQLVTVEELFYYKGIDLEKGKVYFSGKVAK